MLVDKIDYSYPINMKHQLNKRLVSCHGMIPHSYTGGRIRDQFNRNHMTVGSGCRVSLLGPTGRSIAFNSSSLTVPSTVFNRINGNGKISIGLWIYPTAFGSYKSVFDTVNRHASFFMNSGTDFYTGFGGSANGLTGSIAFVTSQWQYLMVTYDGTNVVVYRNGVQTATVALGFTTFTDTLVFGANPSGAGSFYQGKQAGWRVWSRTYNAKQAWAIYQQAKLGFQDLYNYLPRVRNTTNVIYSPLTSDPLIKAYLGRYQRGQVVSITVPTSGLTTACPTVDFWLNGTTKVATAQIPLASGTVFSLTQYLSNVFTDGHYCAIVRYRVGANLSQHFFYFDVIGGSGTGHVINLHELRRPLGRSVVTHNQDGTIKVGYNPRVE